MKIPERFERVTENTDFGIWTGPGSYPDNPFVGLSEYEKFFLVEPKPKRIVQEYTCVKHASNSVCPLCGEIYYRHGEIIEYYYDGQSNVQTKSVVCVGNVVIRFDHESYAATDYLHAMMTLDNWWSLIQWRAYLAWYVVTLPIRRLFKRHK